MKMTIEEMKDDYDWQQVFYYANPHAVFCTKTHVDESSFGLDDVEEIISYYNGENDGDNWVGVFKLKDGRYAMIEAGCDYTGWD